MKTYETACDTPSDINQHLPILKSYATLCNKVTEIGLGSTGNSVMAFIAGCKDVTSYDIEYHDQAINDAKAYSESLGHSWEFIMADSTQIEIEETDFLFIDGEHSYYSVEQELGLHHNRVRMFIGFHDVVSYASRNQSAIQTGHQFTEGIVPAIFEFLSKHPEWQVDYYAYYNHGLLILKRV